MIENHNFILQYTFH